MLKEFEGEAPQTWDRILNQVLRLDLFGAQHIGAGRQMRDRNEVGFPAVPSRIVDAKVGSGFRGIGALRHEGEKTLAEDGGVKR